MTPEADHDEPPADAPTKDEPVPTAPETERIEDEAEPLGSNFV